MKKLNIFVVMICIVLGISGCGKEESVCSENTVHQLTAEIYNPKSQCCVENMIPIYYNNLDDKAKIRFDNLAKNVSIVSVQQKSDNSFEITLKAPDLEKTLSVISKDAGFLVDKNNCELNNGDLEEVYDRYLNSYLSQNTCEIKEVTIPVEVELGTDGNWVISSDTSFIPYIKNATEAVLVDLVTGTGESQGSSDESNEGILVEETDVDITTLTEVSAKGVFVVSQNGHRFLIDDIKIIKNAEALNTIHQLSGINSNYSCSDTLLYIAYTATNISDSEGQINNGFVGIASNGAVLEVDKTVGGLVSTEKIPSGETKQLTACVVLRNDDSLFWYDSANSLKIIEY